MHYIFIEQKNGAINYARESSSVASRKMYFQRRLSMWYVKFRKNGIALIFLFQNYSIHTTILLIPCQSFYQRFQFGNPFFL